MGIINTATREQLKVADEVWIVTALLHREHPDRADFGIEEIVERAQKESLCKNLRKGVYVHVVQHCVANRPPNPGRYRILYETAPGRRRLFRKGDSFHPSREAAKTTPHVGDLPSVYNALLSWYEAWGEAAAARSIADDPLMKLYGSGRDLWADEHADDYVRRLREGWE